MAEVDPAADPAKADPAKTDPAKSDPAAADPADALGAGGKAALDAERVERKAAQKAAKDAKDALDALTAKSATDAEKAAADTARAIAEAKAEVRNEVAAAANARLLKSEIRAAAAGVLADPGDAAALLGDLDRFVDKDGEPDAKAIEAAIARLVKDKPYLAAAGSRAGALPGGGARPASGFSMNDEIRQMAGRG
jgi:hypothetical protein